MKATVLKAAGRSVVIMDSITMTTSDDREKAVVSGSHGGVSSGEFALQHPGAIVMFNDAGRGKEDAGMEALKMLEEAGVAAATIAHTSARIGDSRDHWDSGVISAVNLQARELRFKKGQTVTGALTQWVSTGRATP